MHHTDVASVSGSIAVRMTSVSVDVAVSAKSELYISSDCGIWWSVRRVERFQLVDNKLKNSPIDKIREIYKEIPTLDCKGLCHEYCGILAMTLPEYEVLSRHGQHGAYNHTMLCPKLQLNNMCSAYEYRPLICRLWGVVEDLKCPHGCQPERYLTKQEQREITKRVELAAGGKPGVIPDRM